MKTKNNRLFTSALRIETAREIASKTCRLSDYGPNHTIWEYISQRYRSHIIDIDIESKVAKTLIGVTR